MENIEKEGKRVEIVYEFLRLQNNIYVFYASWELVDKWAILWSDGSRKEWKLVPDYEFNSLLRFSLLSGLPRRNTW